MKKLSLICGAACALLLTSACASPAPANSNATANSNAANRNAATTNAAAPAASPAAGANANATNSSAASTGAAQDFVLVNETGVEIDKVYISPHDKDDWEEDILGKDTLPTGQNVEVKFNRDETAGQWDLRVEDKEGNGIEWENLDLLKISKVTLHYKDKKATAEVE